MKQIFINEENLNEDELDFSVIRVKGLIINGKKEILLAHNNGTYQFPGGHKEENETLEESLIREIKEETGITTKLDNGPFMQITTYDGNYFNTGKKVSNKIYYFVINTDDNPNFSETQYDELECQTEFNLFYVKIDYLREFLEKAVLENSIDSKIAKEMLFVVDEYIEVYGER